MLTTLDVNLKNNLNKKNFLIDKKDFPDQPHNVYGEAF